MNQPELFRVISAADFFDIPLLVDEGCSVIAREIMGKSAEEMRKIFGIENDFTPEEEQKIKNSDEWCTQAI